MREVLTGLILAGGLARRMGGVDKGLQHYQGRALVEHAIARLLPQVSGLLINANRNIDAYRAFGFPVVEDCIAGHVGPLAGMHAGLQSARTQWLACVPCDAPLLPEDLVARLYQAAQQARTPIAVAASCGRMQPVFCLLHRDCMGSLNDFLNAGSRKVESWLTSQPYALVDLSDTPESFANLNTLDALRTSGPHS